MARHCASSSLLPEALAEQTTSRAEAGEAQREGRLLVARDAEAGVVGFALVEFEGTEVHLEEIDVDPDHGRRGIGRALVEAVIDNADGKFLPGMFGEAEIDMETQVATTMLPARCIRFNESGQAFVYLVQSDNQIKVTAVRTGLDTGTEIEVIDGIQPNQIVVGPHLNRFTDGQKVEPL